MIFLQEYRKLLARLDELEDEESDDDDEGAEEEEAEDEEVGMGRELGGFKKQ